MNRPVDVYVDNLYRDKGFKLPGADIIIPMDGISLCSFFRRKDTAGRDKNRFEKALKKNINSYSLVVAVDFPALEILKNIGFDLARTVYLSVEGTDYINSGGHGREYAAELLRQTACCIVQNKERGDDINKYLGADIEFEYLPVSHRPAVTKNKDTASNLKIIYSGYLADWSCLLEFLKAYKKTSLPEKTTMLLQGHSMGTGEYLAMITAEISDISNSAVDLSYYDDRSHSELLAGQDVGIAFYKNTYGSTNFENLLLSSGKISSYLWNGLAILTNINSDEARKPPFIYLESFDENHISGALERFKADRVGYITAAYKLANERYNFDEHFNKIYKKMTPIFSK
jgi:hypothetical protein